MVLTYKQCIEKYGSDHRLKKEIAEGNLFQQEKGIYSLGRNCSELEIISVKYPKAVFTGESAFYYHGLTDVIPDFYHLATVRTDGRMLPRVRALFARVVQYTSLSYHPMYFIMYESICGKGVWERSHRAAHVPKWQEKEMRSTRLQFSETAAKPTRASKTKNFQAIIESNKTQQEKSRNHWK